MHGHIPGTRFAAGVARLVARAAAMALLTIASSAHATVVWEDYRGNANAGILYTGPAAWPSFGNFGPGDPIANLRVISSNPANAIRTGTSTNINFLADTQLCNATLAPTSAACGLQVMGRVSYALIRFPVAGTYTLSVAHDDNVDVDLSSDYANTNYRTASYNVPVGAVGDYTADENTYANLGSFTAAAANSCALIRVYWDNYGGLNFARLRWTRPSPTTTEIIPAAQMFNPGLAASAVGCNGSISGNSTAVTLNKVLGSPRAQASDQFTVEIGTTAAAGTVAQATTSGSSTGQQASTGAYPALTGTTYYLRDLMAAGSASTLATAYTSAIACTRNGTAFTPAGASPTWNVTTAANDQIVCNITNTARPVLRLQKSLPAGRVVAADQFTLAIAGTGAGAGATVTTTGTTNAPTQVATVSPATAASVYAFSETAAAGANLSNYLSSYACTNTLPGGQTPSGNATNFNVTPVAGDNLTCTFSNQAARPTVTLRKTTVGGVGGPFNFTLTNTVQASGTATTTTAGTPLQVDGDTATAGLQPFVVTTASTALVITEAAPPSGYTLTAAACTGMAGAGTAIADLANRTITLNAAATAAGAAIVCTFTNSRPPSLRLGKTLPIGRAQAGDQFSLLISGTGGPVQATTTGTGSTATEVAVLSTATANSVYTLSESAAGTTNLGNYTTTWTCTNALAGGQAPTGNGASFNLTPVAGDDLTCSFANTLLTVPQPSAFSCSVGDFYQVRAASNTNDSIFSIVDRTQNPYALTNPYTVTSARINSMGYNVNDNYLYGLNSPTSDPGGGLVRLGATGVGDLNGAAAGTSIAVAGLPAMSSLNAGEVDLQDNLFITPGIGSGASGLYRIRGITGNFPSPVAVQVTTAADGAPPAGFSGVGLSTSIGDFSLSPTESSASVTVLYGMSGTVLFRLSISNPGGPTPVALVSSRATTLPAGFGVGATYFDTPGTLYVYGNTAGPGEGFASINIATGVATNVSAAPTTSRSDGARCPAAPTAIPPTITLNKITTGAQGGPFVFALTNTARSDGSVTTTNASPTPVDGDAVNAGVQPYTVSAFNTPVVITESSLPAGWSLTGATCTDGGAGVGSLSGNALTLPASSMTSGKQFICTFTNTPVSADISVTKTNATSQVTANAQTSYSLVITNAGPAAANNAVVRDPATAGLTCVSNPTCTSAGGASCPVSLAVADLQGAPGLVIPALPTGGSVTLTLACTVTATGQ